VTAERDPTSRLPSLGPRGEGWVVGQLALIVLEGLMSLQALGALPPRTLLGWGSVGSGLVVAAAGAWVAFRGIRDLGHNLTAVPAPVPGAQLVDTGIYRRVRHPIYAGVILVGIGWALLSVSAAALVVALALAVWLDLKSRREETWLMAHHPGYRAYRARTRRFIAGLY